MSRAYGALERAGTVSDRRFSAALAHLEAIDLERYPAPPLIGGSYELRANVTACDAMEALGCELVTGVLYRGLHSHAVEDVGMAVPELVRDLLEAFAEVQARPIADAARVERMRTEATRSTNAVRRRLYHA